MKKSLPLFLNAIIFVLVSMLPIKLLAQSGSLDLSFGTNGLVTTLVGDSSCGGSGIAVQNDGKILMAGGSYNISKTEIAIVRYNKNGSLDTTFDHDGKVTTPIGTIDAAATSIALQTDGKIVVAGYNLTGTSTFSEFAVARYNTNGSLDTTFNHDGIVTTEIGIGAFALAMVIQSDGKIVAGGYSRDSVSVPVQFTLIRYNTNGNLDSTFDNDGFAKTTIGTTHSSGEALAIQNDGKIIMVGLNAALSVNSLMIIRYNTNGSLDSTFDNDGIVLIDSGFANINHGRSIALQGDGKIIVASSRVHLSGYKFAIFRFNMDGSLDNSFDSDGSVYTPIGINNSDAKSVSIQNDGKIIEGGYCNGDFVLVRYNTNGSLDSTFDVDGIKTTSFGNTGDYGYSVAIQSDGQILLGGTIDHFNHYTFGLARYNYSNSVGFNTMETVHDEIEIYPNPFYSSTTFKTNSIFKNSTLRIYNIIGEEVRRIRNMNGQTFLMTRDNLKSGLYFVQLIEDDKIISRIKMIITDEQ